MYLVPDLPDADTHRLTEIASRLRSFAFTLNIWERKRDDAQAMIDQFTQARELYISRLPELPAWLTERGVIGADCPDDAA